MSFQTPSRTPLGSIARNSLHYYNKDITDTEEKKSSSDDEGKNLAFDMHGLSFQGKKQFPYFRLDVKKN